MLRNLGQRQEVISLEIIIACEYFLLILIRFFFNLVIIVLFSSNSYQKYEHGATQGTQDVDDQPRPKPFQIERKTQTNSSSYRIFK